MFNTEFTENTELEGEGHSTRLRKRLLELLSRCRSISTFPAWLMEYDVSSMARIRCLREL